MTVGGIGSRSRVVVRRSAPHVQWFLDESGAQLGWTQLDDGAATRHLVIDAGSGPRWRISGRGVDDPLRPSVDVHEVGGPPLGTLARTKHASVLEVGGEVVAELRLRRKWHVEDGLAVMVGGVQRADLVPLGHHGLLDTLEAALDECVVTVDPTLPEPLRQLVLLLPVAMAVRAASLFTEPAAADLAASPPAWHADPFGRAELRLAEGGSWTDRVATAGREHLDPVLGARSTATGFGTPLTEPVVVHTTTDQVLDGVRRVLGTAPGIGVVPPEDAQVSFRNLDGSLEASVELVESEAAGPTDLVELRGPAGELLGAYETTWEASGRHYFLEFGVHATLTLDGRPVAAVTGLRTPLVPGLSPAIVTLPDGRPAATVLPPSSSPLMQRESFGPWLGDLAVVHIDHELPLEVRRLIAALPGVARVVWRRHARYHRSSHDQQVHTWLTYR